MSFLSLSLISAKSLPGRSEERFWPWSVVGCVVGGLGRRPKHLDGGIERDGRTEGDAEV